MTDWRAYVRRRLPDLEIGPEREIEIVEELALQLEAAYDAALAAGADPTAARQAAAAEIPDWRAFASSVTRIERRHFSVSIASPPAGGFMRGFLRDAARACASLCRTPGYTFLAVTTLSVGLGLGTATFALVHGVLLAPLPYANPERLVLVHATVPPEGGTTHELAYPDVQDIAVSGAFSSLATIAVYSATTTIVDPAMRVEGLWVSANSFDVLGLAPLLGRPLSADDGREGGEPVVVLGHGLWTRLGSPADIVGRTIVLNEVPRTIIAVAPPGFRVELFPRATDVFVPITSEIGPIATTRAVRAFRAIGRLAADVSPAGADAALAMVAGRLQQAHPTTNQGRTYFVRPLRDVIVDGVRAPLWLVAALVGVVLLIVLVNLSSMLLSRAVIRAREVSIRMALGATRWRLVRESSAEALILAILGTACGYTVARALVAGLRAAPGLTLPRLADVSVAAPAILVLAAVALAIAATLSLVANVSPQRLQAMSALRTGRETSDRRTGVIRGVLVAGQTALAFVLLTSAILLALSLRAVLTTPVGFDTSEVMTMRLMVPSARYASRDDTVSFYARLLDALQARPEIRASGLVSALPLDGGAGSTLTIAGREQVEEAMRPTVRWHWASSSYFAAMGIPLRRGRDFTAADVTRSTHVTIINETLARLYFSAEDPIGKRVYFGPVSPQGITDWHEIIGVVADVRNRTIEEPPPPAVFDLFGQHWGRTVSLAIRSSESPSHLTSLVHGLIAERDPRLALFAVRTTSDLVAGAVSTRRLLLWLVAGFAAIGMLVAVVGLYGTVAYIVAGRTREMGVRIALGATPADIRRLVLAYGLRFTTAGIVVGVASSISMRNVIGSQLFGVTATNGLVLSATAAILVAASAAAALVPSRRAVRVDPSLSLRAD